MPFYVGHLQAMLCVVLGLDRGGQGVNWQVNHTTGHSLQRVILQTIRHAASDTVKMICRQIITHTMLLLPLHGHWGQQCEQCDREALRSKRLPQFWPRSYDPLYITQFLNPSWQYTT